MDSQFLVTRSLFHGNRAAKIMPCAAMLSMAVLASTLGVAASLDPGCAENKTKLNEINKQIAGLESSQAPAQLARDLTDVIDRLIADLREIKGDAGKVIGPVTNAQKRLDQIAKALTDQKVTIPPAWKKLRDSMDGLAKGIETRAKKVAGSAPGRAVSDVKKRADLIGSAIEKLEAVKTGLDAVSAYDKAKNGSGAEQIEALKFGFDQLKSKLGADEVPGLGQFLDAYSTALDGMAKNVGTIERTLNERLKQAAEAVQGVDGAVNFDTLYPGAQSPRDKLQAHLQALRDSKAALEKARAEAECDKPEPPPDPCTDPKDNPDKTRKLIGGLTGKQREAYDGARRDYEKQFMRLSQLSFNEPHDTPSDAERSLTSIGSQIRALQRAVKENDASAFGSTTKATALANDVATRLGVTGQSGMNTLRDAGKLLDRLEPALTQKLAAARKAAQTAHSDAHAKWQKAFDEAKAAAKDGVKKRDAAKASYKKAVGDALAKESAARKWTKEQSDLFDRCFPYLAKLRSASATSTNCPPPQKGGGLVGGINFVTDQMKGCN